MWKLISSTAVRRPASVRKPMCRLRRLSRGIIAAKERLTTEYTGRALAYFWLVNGYKGRTQWSLWFRNGRDGSIHSGHCVLSFTAAVPVERQGFSPGLRSLRRLYRVGSGQFAA